MAFPHHVRQPDTESGDITVLVLVGDGERRFDAVAVPIPHRGRPVGRSWRDKRAAIVIGADGEEAASMRVGADDGLTGFHVKHALITQVVHLRLQ